MVREEESTEFCSYVVVVVGTTLPPSPLSQGGAAKKRKTSAAGTENGERGTAAAKSGEEGTEKCCWQYSPPLPLHFSLPPPSPWAEQVSE